jgi:hypothetical protein
MTADASAIVAALKPVFAGVAKRLVTKVDDPAKYVLVTKSASPFPQHKGHPLDFGSIQTGKAYVSLHLMPIYMFPPLQKTISPALKKRMQGKSCFNFTNAPDPELVAELKKLADLSLQQWAEKNWL